MWNEWTAGRWYRILDPNGKLWMETSDPEEVFTEAGATGWPVLRQWRREETEWRREPVPLDPDRPYLPGVNQCPNCNVGGCQGCDGNGR